jgi:hypothetical protein
VGAPHGAPCEIDLDRTTPEIEAAARRCVPGAFAGGAAGPAPVSSPTAFDED